MPAGGATGYFVELTFASTNPLPIPILSDPFVFTTEIRVKSPLPMHEWPFESAFDTFALGDSFAMTSNLAAKSVTGDHLLNAAASALALESGAIGDENPHLGSPIATLAAAVSLQDHFDEHGTELLLEAPAILELTADAEATVDLVLDELLPELLT